MRGSGRNERGISAFALLLLLSTLAVSPVALADITVPANGSLVQSTTYSGNVKVSAGASFTLDDGATLSGNIQTTGSNARITIFGATVTGNIQAGTGATVTITSSTVNGNVQPSGSTSLTVTGATISGNVQPQNTGTVAITCSTLGGNVQPQGCGTVNVSGNTIQGNLQLQSTSGNVSLPAGMTAASEALDDTVNGNMQLQQNVGGVVATGSIVKGNLQANQNSGGTDVASNSASGNLQCQQDSSPVTCTSGTGVGAGGAGFCSSVCGPKTKFQTDPDNCGACGNVCPESGSCSNGACSPALTVALTGVAVASPGETISYTATATNAGGTAADSVAATVTFPDGTSTSASLGTIAAGASSSANVTWTVPPIPPLGASQTIASYLAEFSAANDTALTAAISVAWKDASSKSYGPENAQWTTTENAPAPQLGSTTVATGDTTETSALPTFTTEQTNGSLVCGGSFQAGMGPQSYNCIAPQSGSYQLFTWTPDGSPLDLTSITLDGQPVVAASALASPADAVTATVYLAAGTHVVATTTSPSGDPLVAFFSQVCQINTKTAVSKTQPESTTFSYPNYGGQGATPELWVFNGPGTQSPVSTGHVVFNNVNQNLESIITTMASAAYLDAAVFVATGNQLSATTTSTGEFETSAIDLDQTPPTIGFTNVTSPANGQITVNGIILDPTVVPTIKAVSSTTGNTVSSATATVTGTTWSATLSVSTDTYNIVATGSDYCGNEATTTTQVIYPLTADEAVISILGVSDGEMTSLPVTPTFTVSAYTPSAKITLPGATTSTPFTSGTQLSAAGTYTLTVSSVFVFASFTFTYASETISFTIASAPPLLEVLCTFNNVSGGCDGQFSGPLTPTANATDSLPVTTSATLASNGGIIDWTLGQPISATGSYVLTVMAIDQAGNTASEQFTFTIQNEPKITILEPTHTAFFLSPMPVDVTYSAFCGVASVSVTIDGADVTSQLMPSGMPTDELKGEVTLGGSQLAVDQFTLVATVTDNCNQTATAQQTFDIDGPIQTNLTVTHAMPHAPFLCQVQAGPNGAGGTTLCDLPAGSFQLSVLQVGSVPATGTITLDGATILSGTATISETGVVLVPMPTTAAGTHQLTVSNVSPANGALYVLIANLPNACSMQSPAAVVVTHSSPASEEVTFATAEETPSTFALNGTPGAQGASLTFQNAPGSGNLLADFGPDDSAASVLNPSLYAFPTTTWNASVQSGSFTLYTINTHENPPYLSLSPVGDGSGTVDTTSVTLTGYAETGQLARSNPQVSITNNGVDAGTVAVTPDPAMGIGSFGYADFGTWSATVALTEGANQISILAKDPCGDSTTLTTTLTYLPAPDTTPKYTSTVGTCANDTKSPVLAIDPPQSSGWIASTAVLISGTVDDANDNVTVTAGATTVAATLEATATGATWAAMAPLAEGSNTITVVAGDPCGNVTQAVFTLDETQATPGISILLPNGEQQPAGEITVSVTVDDDLSGIDLSTLSVILDAVDITQLLAVPTTCPPGQQCAASGNVDMAAGPHSISASVSNNEGISGTDTRLFALSQVSTEGLSIEISSPSGNVATQPVYVEVDYTSDSAGLDFTSVRVLMDGKDITPGLTMGPTMTSGSLYLAAGSHSLTATINDTAGNTATLATSTFAVATAPPATAPNSPDLTVGTVTIANSSQNSTLATFMFQQTNGYVQCSGQITPATPSVSCDIASGGTYRLLVHSSGGGLGTNSISVDGTTMLGSGALASPANAATTTAALSAGTHVISANSPSATLSVALVNDVLAPAVLQPVTTTPDSPASGSFAYSNYGGQGAQPALFVLNDGNPSASSGSLTFNSADQGLSSHLSSNVTATFLPSAAFAASNIYSATASGGSFALEAIDLDQTPPTITLDTISFTSGGVSATLSGTVLDPSASVFVDATQANITGTSWTAVIPTPPGTDEIDIVAFDPAGNYTQISTFAPSTGYTEPIPKSYAAASVLALPDLQCNLYSFGTKPSHWIPIYTDDDGYARFAAVRATSSDAIQQLTLDCMDSLGEPSSYTVDLTADATFAPNPLNLANEKGIDRPALTGDPQQYTKAELIQEGYGLRPDDETSAAYSNWLAAASTPGKILLIQRHPLGSSGPAPAPDQTGGSWTGSIQFGAPQYSATFAEFVVPELVPGGFVDPSGYGTGYTHVSIWNGMNYDSNLIQGGISMIASPSAVTYQAFREYCCGNPNSNQLPNNGRWAEGQFFASAGDDIFSEQWYCDSTGFPDVTAGFGCSFVNDRTTGAVLNCTLPENLKTPSLSPPCWSVAPLPFCSTLPPCSGSGCPACAGAPNGSNAEAIIEDQESPDPTLNQNMKGPWPVFKSTFEIDFAAQAGSELLTVSTDPAISLPEDTMNPADEMNISVGTNNQTFFNVSCPVGEVEVNFVCYQAPPPMCGPNEIVFDNTCVQVPPQPCPVDEVRLSGICRPRPLQVPCPGSEVRVDGICQPP